MNRLLFIAVLLCLMGPADLPAQDEVAAEVRRPLPGRFVEDVLIPVPGEVFSVLEKLGAPDWSQYRERRELPVVGERDRLALLFGMAVAEGFLAVESEDTEAIEAVGQQVIRLATGLGLRAPVEGHAAAILEGSRTQDWNAVRQEFDRAEVTVRETLARMKDEPLARLVSVGGWLRGTQATTAVIIDDYSTDAAELLVQGHVIDHFLKHLEVEEGVIPALRGGLLEIRTQIVPEESGPISLPRVQSIHASCTRLLDGFAGWEPKSQ